jgi:hypothetical protein
VASSTCDRGAEPPHRLHHGSFRRAHSAVGGLPSITGLSRGGNVSNEVGNDISRQPVTT